MEWNCDAQRVVNKIVRSISTGVADDFDETKVVRQLFQSNNWCLKWSPQEASKATYLLVSLY